MTDTPADMSHLEIAHKTVNADCRALKLRGTRDARGNWRFLNTVTGEVLFVPFSIVIAERVTEAQRERALLKHGDTFEERSE